MTRLLSRTLAHRCRDRGAAAVEMAIVLPVLVLLCFGIIDFSRMLNAHLQLSQASREGVRLAALGSGGYTPAQVTQRAKDAAPNPGFTNNAISVDPPSMCSSASTLTATAKVTVHYSYTGILFSHNLSEQAGMRCGG